MCSFFGGFTSRGVMRFSHVVIWMEEVRSIRMSVSDLTALSSERSDGASAERCRRKSRVVPKTLLLTLLLCKGPLFCRPIYLTQSVRFFSAPLQQLERLTQSCC